MSIRGKLQLDTGRFNQALARFARYSQKGGQELLLDAARNFVRRVIALAPPSQGKANAGARKKGEQAIANDVARIFSPATSQFIGRFRDFYNGSVASEQFAHKGAAALGFIYTRALERGEMAGWHGARRHKDGRVGRIGKGEGLNRTAAAHVTTGLRKGDLKLLDIGLVEQRDYEWFKKSLQKHVGFLAGGWNRAARNLGYNPPAWIRRHGEGAGSVSIEMGRDRFVVIVSNDVKYAGNVKDLTRNVQRALDETAAAMDRKVEFYLAKVAKSSGLK